MGASHSILNDETANAATLAAIPVNAQAAQRAAASFRVYAQAAPAVIISEKERGALDDDDN